MSWEINRLKRIGNFGVQKEPLARVEQWDSSRINQIFSLSGGKKDTRTFRARP